MNNLDKQNQKPKLSKIRKLQRKNKAKQSGLNQKSKLSKTEKLPGHIMRLF